MVHDIVLSNKWMTYKRMLKELGLILRQHFCVIKGCMFFAVAYIGRYLFPGIHSGPFTANGKPEV